MIILNISVHWCSKSANVLGMVACGGTARHRLAGGGNPTFAAQLATPKCPLPGKYRQASPKQFPNDVRKASHLHRVQRLQVFGQAVPTQLLLNGSTNLGRPSQPCKQLHRFGPTTLQPHNGMPTMGDTWPFGFQVVPNAWQIRDELPSGLPSGSMTSTNPRCSQGGSVQ
jgi:hypothetical protein